VTRPPRQAEPEPDRLAGDVTIGGVILAAGDGSRFGGPKQLAELNGRPLLEYAVEAMLAVPAIWPVVVVLGAHADEIREQVDLGDAQPILAPDWAHGQSASLRAGVAALGAVDAAVITLGDQPFITPQVIAGMLDQRGARYDAVRATYRSEPGHPVLIEQRVFRWVRDLRGDTGARDLLGRLQVRDWDCAHLCDPTDVDTPEKLKEIQA
jgi:molybdenum cofactor cytidylyltransferase